MHLQPVTEEEKTEARRLAEIAALAERKAAHRLNTSSKPINTTPEIRYIPKKDRNKPKPKSIPLSKPQSISIPSVKPKIPNDESLSPINQQLLTQIKESYLGVEKKRKKDNKKTPKFKFEWDESEDTAKDMHLNPLYAKKAELKSRSSDLTLGVRKRKRLNEMSERDWRIFREDYEIYVLRDKSGVVPNPIRSWDDLEPILCSSLFRAIKRLNHNKPTPIQMQCIPIKSDFIGIAQTGSGKTLAFLIPLIDFVLTRKPQTSRNLGEFGPLALILAPTRELAMQIEEEHSNLVKSSSSINIKVGLLVGGQNIHTQASLLRRGVEIIVGTPGRVIDCLQSKYMVLDQCDYVVLDEADTMVDLGFYEQVEYVLRRLKTNLSNIENDDFDFYEKRTLRILGDKSAFKNEQRRTVMFSATMPETLEKLANQYMSSAATIRIGDAETSHNQSIDQVVHLVSSGGKMKLLLNVLKSTRPPTIVFVNARAQVRYVSSTIAGTGRETAELHAGKSQEARESALRSFKNGKAEILIATDLAGRGLDVKGVKHVINFDMAKNIERYSHRIGRTGRAGLKGLATTFITEEEKDLFEDLAKYLKSTNCTVPSFLIKS